MSPQRERVRSAPWPAPTRGRPAPAPRRPAPALRRPRPAARRPRSAARTRRPERPRQAPRALQLALHRPPGQKAQRVHLKIVKLGDPVPISDVLPMLENFGLRVISERPYELLWPEG